MSSKETNSKRPRSKAALTVEVQNGNRTIGEGIAIICNRAKLILDSTAPSKEARKTLLATAESLLQLQSDISEKIPGLVPSNCSRYSIKRLRTANDYCAQTFEQETAPRANLRQRTFDVHGAPIPLPKNRKQYTALEVCAILLSFKKVKNEYNKLSLNKIVDAMISFKLPSSEIITPLIPCGRSAMFRHLDRYQKGKDVMWSLRGKRPILPNATLLNTINIFEKDEGRAVGKDDLRKILKNAKQEVARNKGNSTVLIKSPTQRTINNYMGLIPQLDECRSKSIKVQRKSEARYIAERSLRNAVSHLMAVAVAHYIIGKPDKRLKSIEHATEGAKKLYDLISKENDGLELRVILPMFISTTDDTTVFAFEGSVKNEGEYYLINKDNDTGTHSAYTQNSSSTDHLRGI